MVCGIYESPSKCECVECKVYLHYLHLPSEVMSVGRREPPMVMIDERVTPYFVGRIVGNAAVLICVILRTL